MNETDKTERETAERPAEPGAPGRAGPGPRALYRAVGYAGLALAAAGVVLPLLPTVPFLIVAAWGFARSDPERLERLRRDPRFGPLLCAWQAERAIPTRAKVVAVLMMAGSWTLVAVTASSPLLPAILGAVLASVALYIVTRPVPGAGKR